MSACRVTGRAILPSQQLPPLPSLSSLPAGGGVTGGRALVERLQALAPSVSERYLRLDFASALRDLMLLLGDCNAFFDANETWRLR